MEEINLPPPESAVMIRASLSAILNHMMQPDLTFLRRQGIFVGLGILYLKEEVIVLVGLVIVVTAFLDLTLSIPSGASVSRAPATGAVDSPVGVVAKIDTALAAVPVLTLQEMSGIFRDLFEVEAVFGDIVLGCARDGAGNSCCHDGQNSEKASDLHGELVCKDWNWIVVYAIVRVGRC